ncbi:cation diffusion facilitator family transporter [Patescibacteria group bacterium]|nr:cation diffusion facilitator family transporter [Patescibacteria group bacterium]
MGHEHAHSHSKKRLLFAFCITVAVFFAEVFFGFFVSKSLSLASDGIHMLSHIFVFGCVYFALGDPRAEVRATVATGVILIAMSLFILSCALYRLHEFEEVQSIWMLTVASIGLLANLAQIYILYPTDRKNISLRGFFYHILSDTGISVAVVCGGLVLYFTGWSHVDTILTFLIFPLIFWGGVSLIRNARKVAKE